MFLKRRKIWLAGMASLVSPAAIAGDIAGYPRDKVYSKIYETPAFSWQGAYAGLHSGSSSRRLNPFAGGEGLTGGVQAGYNLQFGRAVVGAEIEGSYLGGAEQPVPGGSLEETWRAAAKARAGLSFDRTLLFGTVGYTLTRLDPDDSIRRRGSWESGYLFGGGVEHSFVRGWSAKLEYNYVGTPGVRTTTALGSSDRDLTSHVLKIGLNYRFGN